MRPFNRTGVIEALHTIRASGALEGQPEQHAVFEELSNHELRWYWENWIIHDEEDTIQQARDEMKKLQVEGGLEGEEEEECNFDELNTEEVIELWQAWLR